MEDRRGEYSVLVGRSEGKRPLGRIILKSFSKKWMEALNRIGKGGGLL